MKLALGTVQFGLDYGITNKQGKVSVFEVSKILSLAKNLGINTLDSAHAYGESQQVLGQLQASNNFNIVTKLPTLYSHSEEVNESLNKIEMLFNENLRLLECQKVYALMFHNADDLLSPQAKIYYQQFTVLKKQKKVKKFGVSIYHPSQLRRIIESFAIDIVQLPLNCLDQRFINKNMQQTLLSQVEVHARSLFLQGTLLMPLEDLAGYFQPYKVYFAKFHSLCHKLKCQPLTLALAIIHQNSFIDKAVVGCCTAIQLEEIVEHYHLAKNLLNNQGEQLNDLACSDEQLINPSLWF